MSAKRTPIPKTARAVAITRHFVKSLRKPDSGNRPRKGGSEGREVGNSWVRCRSCNQFNPPTAYLCSEHLWVCGSCCDYPHDEDDEYDQELPGLEGDEDGEDDER
ncbi:MAG TPA: hypothetical protein VGL46_05100 [Pseudonocardiaceae bacterium]|jgi:hypothetical protein